MKVGLYASMFAQGFRLLSGYRELHRAAYELRLDVIDFRSDVGFHSDSTDDLLATSSAT